MTEMLNKEFSRKSFVKGGGAMIVGFSARGAALGAQGGEGRRRSVCLDGPVRPDLGRLVARRSTPTTRRALKLGKVEMGQGTPTGAADDRGRGARHGPRPDEDDHARHERDAEPGRRASAARAMQTGGKQTRAAAAAAKQALLGLASTSLGVPTASLTVKEGVVSGGGKTVTYGALIGDKLFNVDDPAAGNATTRRRRRGRRARSRSASTSSSARARRASTSRTRSPASTRTSTTSACPGMLHGRIVRPRGQGAYGDGTAPKIVSVDESSIKHIPGAQIVRFGDSSSASSRRRSTRRSRLRRS